jgi:16S rRNA (adenine1518-N6/adenine1519-N6)-dimethyltransferase
MTEQYQHRARKRFGQNFLHDAGVIDRILRSIHAKPTTACWKSARARAH